MRRRVIQWLAVLVVVVGFDQGSKAWARTLPVQPANCDVPGALIAAGALGNLIDRVRDGAVTDFIRWHVHDHMWPIFNVADAALLVGVALLLVEGALRHRNTSQPARPLHTLDV